MPIALAAFVATMPLVVLPGNDNPSALPQSVLLQVGVAFFWTSYLLGRRRVRATDSREFFTPVLALLIWSAVSIFWATDSHISQRLLTRWLAAAGLVLLISSAVQSMAQVLRLMSAVFLSSVVVSIVGLLQHLWSFDLVPQAFPPAGTLGNKNVAAEFVVAAIAPGVLFLFSSGRTLHLLALAPAVAVCLAFVVHSGCRAAWMALGAQAMTAAALIYVGHLRVRWTTARVVAMGLGGFCFWVLISQPPADSEQLGPARLVAGATRPLARLLSGSPEPPVDLSVPPKGDLLAERSAVIRLGIWRNTRRMIRASPLSGVGLGNFSVEYPLFSRGGAEEGLGIDKRVDSAHNDYLQLLAELGLVGCLLTMWAAVALTRAAAVVVRAGTPDVKDVVLFSGLGLVGLMASAAVSPIVNQPALLSVGATFVGVILWCTNRSDRLEDLEGPAIEQTSQRGRGLALATVAASLVIVSAQGLADVRADRHVLKMAQAEQRQDWDGVIREGLLARRLNPGRMDFRFPTASAFLRTGQPEGATDLLEEILTVDPHNANALGNLAIARMTLGDFEGARARLNQLLSLRPGDTVASGLLASVESSDRLKPQEGVRTR